MLYLIDTSIYKIGIVLQQTLIAHVCNRINLTISFTLGFLKRMGPTTRAHQELNKPNEKTERKFY